MPNPFTLLGSGQRKIIYALYGLVAIVIGCVDVWYGDNDPEWVGNALRVLGYLTAPMSVLAASNTPAAPEEIVEAIEDANAHDPDDGFLDPHRD